jgi:hypothetical protein
MPYDKTPATKPKLEQGRMQPALSPLQLQLTEEVPFPINCCLGMGYAFITTDGTRGTYLCQGG